MLILSCVFFAVVENVGKDETILFITGRIWMSTTSKRRDGKCLIGSRLKRFYCSIDE